MEQIVIRLGSAKLPGAPAFVTISLQEPAVLGDVALPLDCTAADPAFVALAATLLNTDSVKVAGERLYNAVMANPHIETHVKTALQAVVGSRYPISIEIATKDGAEALPWEAMCSPDGDFLGLDERWSLARMVKPRAEPAPFYMLTPPIRIAAVLSCLDISAAGELDALRRAVLEAGDGNTELLVVMSEEQLIVDLRDELANGDCPEVTQVELMPDDLGDLQRLISDFGPHVLHFFCHGSLGGGSPFVAMAKKEDWSKHPRVSSITAEAGQFGDFTTRTADLPWLVVLNCCEGAGVNPGTDSTSLALSLVVNGMAAAAVGMREPVIDSTANQVTEALYGKLLTDLVARIEEAEAAPKPLDWPRLLVAARDRLTRSPGKSRSQVAASMKEWTLPVIYVRPQQFNLQVSKAPPMVRDDEPRRSSPEAKRAADLDDRAARLEIQALQSLLTDLPPGQADDLKTDAAVRIQRLCEQLGVELPPAGAPK